MPKRIMGKSSGATIHEDGSIDLAPIYADEFRSIARREAALKQIQTSTLQFVQGGLEECFRDSARLWKRIGDDLELDYINNEIIVQHRGVEGARLIVTPLPPQTGFGDEPQAQNTDTATKNNPGTTSDGGEG